jgi:hypothetical protein
MNINTIFPDFDPDNMMNVWWSLPTNIQDKVKQLVPDKDVWTLNMSKVDSGVWVFSLPQFLTFNESMCNGTEKVMDYWFEQLVGHTPVTGSKMKVTISKVQPTSFTTKIIHLFEDPMWPESNIYYDKGSEMDVWLCPYLQVLFKSVPESLWITFQPIK